MGKATGGGTFLAGYSSIALLAVALPFAPVAQEQPTTGEVSGEAKVQGGGTAKSDTATAVAGHLLAALLAAPRYIVFQSWRGGSRYDIYVYDLSAKSVVNLPNLNSGADEMHPSITRDGRFIAFDSNRAPDGRFHIYLYDRKISSLVVVKNLHRGYEEQRPSISADGG